MSYSSEPLISRNEKWIENAKRNIKNLKAEIEQEKKWIAGLRTQNKELKEFEVKEVQ